MSPPGFELAPIRPISKWLSLSGAQFPPGFDSYWYQVWLLPSCQSRECFNSPEECLRVLPLPVVECNHLPSAIWSQVPSVIWSNVSRGSYLVDVCLPPLMWSRPK
ncbi:unnamed protein product [Arabidopsis lyrata]|nr:unnamed protein product [Arabidopsis lyrata]